MTKVKLTLTLSDKLCEAIAHHLGRPTNGSSLKNFLSGLLAADLETILADYEQQKR